MTDAVVTNSAPPATARPMRLPTQWLGVAPFFIFAVLFLLLPTMYLIIGAFQDRDGSFTLQNVAKLFEIPPSGNPIGFR